MNLNIGNSNGINSNSNNGISSGINPGITSTSDNINVSNQINSNRLIINRESELNEFSNFNLNAYSEFTGNEVISESGYMNRNFDSHLDEIFDNLTYLITSEK